MARKVFRSGNSTVVSIPPAVLELLDLEPGDEVQVEADPERRRIVVTPREGAKMQDHLEVRELIERYAPALERLAELEEAERAAADRGIDAQALHRARALRASYAADHGVLTEDLVDAARAERKARGEEILEGRGEGQDHEPGR